MSNFRLIEGDGRLILSIPHAGTRLTRRLAERMTPAGQSLIDTDWWLERLYDVPEITALRPTILVADLSRYVIDLNRDPRGASLYPGQATTGLLPLTTFDGEAIYLTGQEPTATEYEERLEDSFWPYHLALMAQLERVRDRHGIAGLYDCHSIRSVVPRLFDGQLPDLNLGTNSGTSCAPGLTQAVAAELKSADGFSHVIDGRFKGGWITRNYGLPAERVHAVQMELACRRYLSESAPFLYDEAGAAVLQRVLARVLVAMDASLSELSGRTAARPDNSGLLV